MKNADSSVSTTLNQCRFFPFTFCSTTSTDAMAARGTSAHTKGTGNSSSWFAGCCSSRSHTEPRVFFNPPNKPDEPESSLPPRGVKSSNPNRCDVNTQNSGRSRYLVEFPPLARHSAKYDTARQSRPLPDTTTQGTFLSCAVLPVSP